jgi:hypothetical protein
VGDTVRYSSTWLRNTGQFTGDICHAKGKVIALSGTKDYTIATIEWDKPDLPEKVNVANLERVRQRGHSAS